MKTIRATYTFTVTRDVAIRDDNQPAHYSPEEWEEQQLLDVGDEIADTMGSGSNWHYSREG